MKLVINHLTRARQGYMCVGGVDVDTLQHVRPVLKSDLLPTRLLARYRGPFDMANLVDLGATTATPTAPHIEDYIFKESRAKLQGMLDPCAFWTLLTKISRTTLQSIFGSELRHLGGGAYGTSKNEGAASLGCLVPAEKPVLCVREKSGKPQIRMKFADGTIKADARVTDIRLYAADHVTPEAERVAKLRTRIVASECVIMSVGLTREWASSPDREPVHWLQVNNLHLKENPVWQLG